MNGATQAVQQEQPGKLGRVRGDWSVSPLRDASALLGVLKREGLAGSGLVKSFEKWVPSVIGCSRTDMNKIYREQTGHELTDYILTQRADKIVRYNKLPPEAEVFRQIILKSRVSPAAKPNSRKAAVHAKPAKLKQAYHGLYKVRVKVVTTRGEHDGTVLLTAANGHQAVKRAKSETAGFFNVAATAVRATEAEHCCLEGLLVIDGRVMSGTA